MIPMCITFAVVDAFICSLLLIIARHGTNKKTPYRLMAVTPGIGAIGLAIAASLNVQDENVILPLIILSFLGMFMLPGLWQIVSYFCCTLAVTAKCKGMVELFNAKRTFLSYATIFSYEINGKAYMRSSISGCGERRWKRLYAVDTSYIIHVDPRHPQRCVDKRCFPVGATVAVVITTALCFLCL